MPAPMFLVEDLIVEGAAVALVGASNVGKTFVGLDLAFAVAQGRSWHGYQTRPGKVVYIIAEGRMGIGSRVLAWRLDRKIPDGVPAGVLFWDEPVQIASVAHRQSFMFELAQSKVPKPALIVVDTLARCFVGYDENSAQSMGQFVAGIDAIRSSGAAVLVLHHTGHAYRDKQGRLIPNQRERGSTALRGAVDALLYVEPGPQTGDLVVRSQKQREGELIEPLWLRLRSVDLPDGTTSCVVDDAPWTEGATAKLPERWLEAIRVLGRCPTGATTAEWLKLSQLPRATYHRMRRIALERGIVIELNGRFELRRPPQEDEHVETKTEEPANG